VEPAGIKYNVVSYVCSQPRPANITEIQTQETVEQLHDTATHITATAAVPLHNDSCRGRAAAHVTANGC